MKILFDSNVWRHIASPDHFPNDPSITSLRKIRDSILNTEIIPYISETVFTLETIERKKRKEFISKYRPGIVFTEKIDNQSTTTRSIIQSDSSKHYGNHPILAEHLNDAISIGFRIVRFPRLAGIKNPEIEKLRYKFTGDNLKNYHEKLFEVGTRIQSIGAGFEQIKILGEKYDPNWIEGIDKAPDEEWGYIANAMAEWADGDSVAISIALRCEFMCTRDIAKKSGEKSVFGETNLKLLKSEFGFETITPDKLASMLKIR
ncbi:MAG: hypothetical protein WCS03_10955 [Bacteroidota bacterium]